MDEHLINKILLWNIHPVAELMKAEFAVWKNRCIRGSYMDTDEQKEILACKCLSCLDFSHWWSINNRKMRIDACMARIELGSTFNMSLPVVNLFSPTYIRAWSSYINDHNMDIFWQSVSKRPGKTKNRHNLSRKSQRPYRLRHKP